MRSEQAKPDRKVSCQGSCHCGRVRIEVRLPMRLTASRCNCSICTKTGFVHVIVEREDLNIVTGQDELTPYRFNTGTARHLFCRHCGVKPFYVPRSHPEGYSVNLNCLEMDSEIQIRIDPFDGRNWRKNIDKLRREE